MKKFKCKIIGVLLGLAAVFTAAGCSLNKSEDQIKEQYNLNACVTYYGNGGCFNDKGEKTEVTLWLDATSAYPYNMPSDNEELNESSDHQAGKGTMHVSRDRYVFEGWYYALLDETTGEPLVDENGNIQLGDPVDFSNPISVGDHLYVVAKWSKKEHVEIRLVSDIQFTATVQKFDAEGNQMFDKNGMLETESKVVKTGDVLQLKEYSTTSKTVRLSYSSEPASSVQGASFFAYYADAECTQMLTGTDLTIRPLGNGQNQVIYAKYIEGDWEVIRSNEDYTKLFNSAAMKDNYWLLCDLDLTGKSITPRTSFSGTIMGNGHTIKGLKVAAASVARYSTTSIFGKIEATAKISGLTLEDWSLNIGTNIRLVDTLTVYMFCTSIADGATLENVTIKGGSITVKKAKTATITNICGPLTEGGEPEWYSAENYLFGGLGTDEAFLTKYTGVTVDADAVPSINIENN